MMPMSRFSGCIAAEQRRIEVLDLVANQRANTGNSGESRPVLRSVTESLGRLVTGLRELILFRAVSRESQFTGRSFAE